MEVKVKMISDWDNALSAARFTAGKVTAQGQMPSFDWKMAMCRAEHSPIREVIYRIECVGMPWRVLWHLVRHHIGIEKYVRTSRPDRRPNATTDLYDVVFTINAQALIQISRVRLCNKAWHETVTAWKEILAEISKVDSVVPAWCVPSCVLRGACPELECCGFVKSDKYKDWRKRYLSHFNNVGQ